MSPRALLITVPLYGRKRGTRVLSCFVPSLPFYNPRTEEEMRDARCSLSSSLPSASGEAARAAPLFFLDASTGRMVLRRPATEAPAPTAVEARAAVVSAAERASGESAPAAAHASRAGPVLRLRWRRAPPCPLPAWICLRLFATRRPRRLLCLWRARLLLLLRLRRLWPRHRRPLSQKRLLRLRRCLWRLPWR